jgi:hypothetical protein
MLMNEPEALRGGQYFILGEGVAAEVTKLSTVQEEMRLTECDSYLTDADNVRQC